MTLTEGNSCNSSSCHEAFVFWCLRANGNFLKYLGRTHREYLMQKEKESVSSAAGPGHGEILCNSSAVKIPPPKPLHAGYRQLGPSVAHFSLFNRWSAVFNKLVVCPASLSSPGFDHWGLLWCFWGVTHPLWVWLRSGPGHCVVEIQRLLHCLSWKFCSLALSEGQCRGEPLNERSTWEIYSQFGHMLDMLSVGRAEESLICPLLGLPDDLWWI